MYYNCYTVLVNCYNLLPFILASLALVRGVRIAGTLTECKNTATVFLSC